MEETEKINIKLITDYLESNYVILNNTFISKESQQSVWGYSIAEDLELILNIDEDLIIHIMKCWVVSKGMPDRKWDKSFMAVILKTVHKPDIQIQLSQIIGVNGEKQMINFLSDQLCQEIDEEILRQLKKKVGSFVEFENLMKCLGYVFTEVVYDADTLKPIRHIVSTTEYDKIYEQQNNPYWKDWFRARGPNQET